MIRVALYNLMIRGLKHKSSFREKKRNTSLSLANCQRNTRDGKAIRNIIQQAYIRGAKGGGR